MIRFRWVLWTTALLSSLLGAGGAYFALTIPNDLRAESLLKDAREGMRKGDRDAARASLLTIIEKYPRTDAAAAASRSLFAMLREEQQASQQEVGALRVKVETLQKNLSTVSQQAARAAQTAAAAAARPIPPAPKPAVKAAPRPPVKKKAPAKAPARRRRADLRERDERPQQLGYHQVALGSSEGCAA